MSARQPDYFVGTWLISEYVYAPDGTFIGTLRRRQRYEPQSEAHTRVFLSYDPHMKANDHLIACLAGDWTFEMNADGRLRRYYGPDVIGTAQNWGADLSTSKGLWRQVGLTFTSYTVLLAPNRLLMGAKFYRLGELVAVTVGVGTPEAFISGDYPYPAFTNPARPQEVTPLWYGTSAVYDPGHRVHAGWNVVRHYTPLGWRDEVVSGGQTAINLDDMGSYSRISGSGDGVARRYGWSVETTLINTPSLTSEYGAFGEVWTYDTVEILDAASKTLISLTHSYADGTFAQLSLTKFKPSTMH